MKISDVYLPIRSWQIPIKVPLIIGFVFFLSCQRGAKKELGESKSEILFNLLSPAEEGKPGEAEIHIVADEAFEASCINCDNFELVKEATTELKTTFRFNFRATTGESYLCPLNFRLKYKESGMSKVRRFGVYFCPEGAGCSTSASTGCLIN